jgi:hypothetical protein
MVPHPEEILKKIKEVVGFNEEAKNEVAGGLK